MIQDTRQDHKQAWPTVGLALFAAPIVFGYAMMVWTLIRYLADIGSAVVGG
jgi:hypothetical protein